MVFLASFVVFLFFVLALSLSLILKRGPMKTEDEALSSVLDGGACATCSQMCAMAGKKTEKKPEKCLIGTQEIPHKTV